MFSAWLAFIILSDKLVMFRVVGWLLGRHSTDVIIAHSSLSLRALGCGAQVHA